MVLITHFAQMFMYLWFVSLNDTLMMNAEATETCRWILIYDKIKYTILMCLCWFVTYYTYSKQSYTEMYPRIPLGSARHYGNQCFIVFSTPCSKDSYFPWRRPPLNQTAGNVSHWAHISVTTRLHNLHSQQSSYRGNRQHSKHNNRRPPVTTPPFSHTQSPHHRYI